MPPHELLLVFGGIFVMLVIASFVTWWLKKAKPQHDWSELAQRIQSWWFMALVFAAAIAINQNISIIFFALISFLALKEYFTLVPAQRAHRQVLFWAYLSIPVQFLIVYIDWYGMFLIFIPVYMFLLIPVILILIGESKGFLRSVGSVHWGMMLMVFGLSHLAYLLVLPEGDLANAGGGGLVLYVVVLTQSNDVGQYIFGKLFGRHKIIPKVSPNKTWEGLIGGVVVTIGLAFLLAPLLTPLDTAWFILASGVILGLGGFVGDINISALKRDLGVKDTGSSIPGHGGIMDRIDSLTYTAPIFFHFTRYFF